jgi:1,4-alpha-glucan branching enzyme
MPGLAAPIEDGGYGFDYRMAMNVPDYWIKMIKEQRDEDWNIEEMWGVLTNRLPKVKTVAYAESHDQAMVGDKTIAFRLMDKEMYFAMNKGSENLLVERGMALHKMIRLMTISVGGDAYLNFMGNEFGHPEWIDFPREGNDWSYAHARRQWSLADNGFLRYGQLGLFDKEMLKVVKKYKVLSDGYPYKWHSDWENKTLAFSHKGLYFVFNWSPENSCPDYRVEVPWAGKYTVELSTDEGRFGGFDRQTKGQEHFTETIIDEWDNPHHFIQIYNTARTAMVLKWHK